MGSGPTTTTLPPTPLHRYFDVPGKRLDKHTHMHGIRRSIFCCSGRASLLFEVWEREKERLLEVVVFCGTSPPDPSFPVSCSSYSSRPMTAASVSLALAINLITQLLLIRLVLTRKNEFHAFPLVVPDLLL